MGKRDNKKDRFVWQWPENDGSWHVYDANTQILLDELSIGQTMSITAGKTRKFTYSVTKTSQYTCSQTNTKTSNVRRARKAKVLLSFLMHFRLFMTVQSQLKMHQK